MYMHLKRHFAKDILIAWALGLLLFLNAFVNKARAESFWGPVSQTDVEFAIDLPRDYDTSDVNYPVIYFLHGAGAQYTAHQRSGYVREDLYQAVDQGLIEDSIIVYANGYFDSHWADSFDGTKPAETTVIFDLIPYIEANYRVKAGRENRALVGFSMGGYGVGSMISRHPDVFCCGYAMDGPYYQWNELKESVQNDIFGGDENYFSLFSPFENVAKNADALKDVDLRLVYAALESMIVFSNHLNDNEIPHSFVDVDAPHSVQEVLIQEALAGWQWLGEHYAMTGAPPEPEPYYSKLTHGPIFGNVRANGVTVMVRSEKSRSARIKLIALDDYDQPTDTVVYTNYQQTTQASDYTTHFSIGGLSPETKYAVNVELDTEWMFAVPESANSGPSVKTFAIPGVSRDFSVVMLNDFSNLRAARQEVIDAFRAGQPYNTYESASNEEPAFVFIGGDFDHRHAFTLEEKRQTYRDLYNPNPETSLDSEGALARFLLNNYPIAHHWDDHDSGQDNADKNYPFWDLNYQVFNEYVPNYINRPNQAPGIWQKFKYGQVEFFVLDNRSQRDYSGMSDVPIKSMLNGPSYEGAKDQFAWLIDGLNNSTAQWKIVFSSVVVNPIVKPADSWGAYQKEWGYIKNNIKDVNGVVFVSGDAHIGAIDSGFAMGYPEMVVPMANFPDPGINGRRCSSGQIPTNAFDIGVYGVPFGDWTGECSGYGVLEFSADGSLRLTVKDQNGYERLSHLLSAPH